MRVCVCVSVCVYICASIYQMEFNEEWYLLSKYYA